MEVVQSGKGYLDHHQREDREPHLAGSKLRWWLLLLLLLLCGNCIDVTLSFSGGLSISLITWWTLLKQQQQQSCVHTSAQCTHCVSLSRLCVHCLQRQLNWVAVEQQQQQIPPFPKFDYVWLCWMDIDWSEATLAVHHVVSIYSLIAFSTFSFPCSVEPPPPPLSFTFSQLY